MQDEEVCSIANAFKKTISSYKNGLKIVHLNAQSLLKKIDELRFLFTKSNVDVMCVSETWFVHVIRTLFVKALMFIGPIVLVVHEVLLCM